MSSPSSPKGGRNGVRAFGQEICYFFLLRHSSPLFPKGEQKNCFVSTAYTFYEQEQQKKTLHARTSSPKGLPLVPSLFGRKKGQRGASGNPFGDASGNPFVPRRGRRAATNLHVVPFGEPKEPLKRDSAFDLKCNNNATISLT